MIPCKSPKILTTPGEDGFWHLICHVPGCTWTYKAAVKVDAADQKRYHRQAHTFAVPPALVSFTSDPHGDLTYYGACLRCESRSDPTLTKKADAQRWLDHHLEQVHGLVRCP